MAKTYYTGRELVDALNVEVIFTCNNKIRRQGRPFIRLCGKHKSRERAIINFVLEELTKLVKENEDEIN